MNKRLRLLAWLIVWQGLASLSMLYAQRITSASGIVRDSISGEPLSYVSVLFDNSTIGAMTDDNGAFTIQNDKGLTKLVISSLGYDTKAIDLKVNTRNDLLEIELKPTTFEISEVVVKPKRERYSRKNNPAVELIKQVIEHKNDNRIEVKEEYQTEVYETGV